MDPYIYVYNKRKSCISYYRVPSSKVEYKTILRHPYNFLLRDVDVRTATF